DCAVVRAALRRDIGRELEERVALEGADAAVVRDEEAAALAERNRAAPSGKPARCLPSARRLERVQRAAVDVDPVQDALAVVPDRALAEQGLCIPDDDGLRHQASRIR